MHAPRLAMPAPTVDPEHGLDRPLLALDPARAGGRRRMHVGSLALVVLPASRSFRCEDTEVKRRRDRRRDRGASILGRDNSMNGVGGNGGFGWILVVVGLALAAVGLVWVLAPGLPRPGRLP